MARELEDHERPLRSVFDPSKVEFSAILARISVLFEDLRIEEYASRLDTLDALDVVGATYRKIYFLRRSIATLCEFAGAIEMLDQRAEFRALHPKFPPDQLTRWHEAKNYFREWKGYLGKIRADFGGHFDHESARHAVREMDPEIKGKIVVVLNHSDEKGGVRLNYAMEIVEAAMTRRKPDDHDKRQYFHDMFVVARAGQQMAVQAVHALSIVCLLPKFGRQM